MRKIFTVISFMIGLSLSTYAQTITPQQIYKLANRDAEKLVKAGWKPAVNMPSIDRQLNNAYLKEYRKYDGEPQFIMGFSTRRGLDYHRVHSEAMSAARKEISNKMGADVLSEFNSRTVLEGSNTHQHTRSNTISTARQKLRKTDPVVDIFRELKDGEVEVEVRIAYDRLNNNN